MRTLTTLCTVIACALTAARVSLAQNTAQPVVASTPIQRTVYFESHGRDDLREWPAAMEKGAQYIKIDFNFIEDPWTCATQTRLVNEQPDPTLPPNQMFPNGCFVLVHWYANSTFDFNTTTDLLSLFADPANSKYFSNASGHAPIVPQLCFKRKPSLCPSTDPLASKWIALMDDFYNRATGMVDLYGLNLRFAFDQLNIGDRCVFERYPRWVSTWTGDRATALNNNVTEGNDVFQMVNMEWDNTKSWEWLLDGGFYKFVNASYAFVGWEPSLQVEIEDFFGPYLGRGPVHAPGVVTAYNGDPSMFHVFTANITGQHANVAVGSPRALSSETAYLDAWGVMIACSALQYNTSAMSTLIECTVLVRGQNARFDVLATSSGWIPIQTFDAVLIMPVFANSGTSTTRIVFSGAHWLALGSLTCSVDDNNRATTCGVAYDAAPAEWSTFSHVDLDKYIVDVSLTPLQDLSSNTSFYLAIARMAKQAPHSIEVDVWQVGLHSFDIDPIMYGVLMTANAYANSSYANVSALPADAAMSVAAAAQLDGMSLVVTWVLNRHVYVAAMETLDGAVVPDSYAAPVVAGIGRNPSAFLHNHWVGITFDSSFCFNSEWVDDDSVMFLGVKECNLRDSNAFEILPNPVLAYVYGPMSVLIDRIQRGNEHQHGFATVCDAELLHGAFDLGYRPSSLLLKKDTTRFGDDSIVDNSHWFVSTAVSLVETDVLCMCGSPKPHEGRIVVDAFPMRGFYNMTSVTRRPQH